PTREKNVVVGPQWAQRPGRPTGCAGQTRKVGVVRQTSVEWVKAQN
ncbi:hypothetical protein BIFBRE_05078, partial [Bifidobacterium breve DSM 20213 = JCM 1192]